jgi:hypothetical protein
MKTRIIEEVGCVEDVKFYDYEDFQSEHPEVDPEWREFVEPVIMGVDESVYGFIVGYLLM